MSKAKQSDRRKNYYKNEGKPIEQIISIGKLSQAVMSILLGRPNDARARPSSLLKDDVDYMAVFNPKYNIDLYRICATILEKVETFLKLEELALETRERNNIKFHLVMYAAMCAKHRTKLSVADIASLDIQSFNSSFLKQCFDRVWAFYQSSGGDDRAAKGTDFRHELILDVSEE